MDEVKQPGLYAVTFSTNDLAEGVYSYTIEMKGTESDYYSKKTEFLILIK